MLLFTYIPTGEEVRSIRSVFWKAPLCDFGGCLYVEPILQSRSWEFWGLPRELTFNSYPPRVILRAPSLVSVVIAVGRTI